jgi:YGGT family
MTYERKVVTRTDEDPAVVAPAGTTYAAPGATRTNQVVERTQVSPSGGEMLRRVVVLIFGIIQALIILRIVLLLLNAREGNDLVSFILNASQIFVAPFVGIFNSDALKAGGSVLDIAAIAALVGWTILEAIVLWAVNLLRREPV